MLSKSAIAAVIVVVGLLSLFPTLDAKRPKRIKKPRPIDWNHTYYDEKFGLCKKLRNLNPVELMRAQAWAADIFRRCAARAVVEFATKCNFPAYGIERVTDFLCFAVNLSYAYLANDGTLTLEDSMKTSRFLDFASAFFTSLSKINHNFTVRYRRETLLIPLRKVGAFTMNVIRCGFDTQIMAQLDGDVAKHAIGHSKVMLL